MTKSIISLICLEGGTDRCTQLRKVLEEEVDTFSMGRFQMPLEAAGEFLGITVFWE
jgi:hypothetical protein